MSRHLIVLLLTVHLAGAAWLRLDRFVEDRIASVLVTRQSQAPPQVPPQCQSVCDPVNSVLSQTCAVATCCTDTFETNYFNCFICAQNAVNNTDFSTAQSDINQLISACAKSGVTSLPTLVFPGQPGATSSSVSGSSSPTSSSSSPTSSLSSSSSSSQSTSRISQSTFSPTITKSTATAPLSITTSPLFTQSTATTSLASGTPAASQTSHGNKIERDIPLALGFIVLAVYWAF